MRFLTVCAICRLYMLQKSSRWGNLLLLNLVFVVICSLIRFCCYRAPQYMQVWCYLSVTLMNSVEMAHHRTFSLPVSFIITVFSSQTSWQTSECVTFNRCGYEEIVNDTRHVQLLHNTKGTSLWFTKLLPVTFSDI